MILRPLGPCPAYRMHSPRWAAMPTSGAGAAAHGGRANRPGLATLYLALAPETAIAEYQQLSTLMPPGTLVAYTVKLDPVVDFSAGFDPQHWSDGWADFMRDWREPWFNRRTEPPGWAVSDAAIKAGAKGVLFASTRHPGGFSLAVYNDALAVTDQLQTYDPTGALPKNQDSWR